MFRKIIERDRPRSSSLSQLETTHDHVKFQSLDVLPVWEGEKTPSPAPRPDPSGKDVQSGPTSSSVTSIPTVDKSSNLPTKPDASIAKSSDVVVVDMGSSSDTGARKQADLVKKENAKRSMHHFVFVLVAFLMMISFPVAIVSMTMYPSLWFSYNANIFWALPSGIATTLLFWTITARFRRWLLVYKGFDQSEIDWVFHHRNKDFPLDEMRAHHASPILRFCDGIPRKSNHILTTLFNLLYVSFILTDDTLRMQTAIIGQILNIIVSFLVFRSDGGLAIPFYGSSSRIRDGLWGRLNLIVVRVVGLITLVLVASLLSFMRASLDLSEKEEALLLVYIYIPTALGDAAGEVIGSLYGKLEFKVWGIGEVNKKTVEGTSSVFAFSFVPMLVLAAMYDAAGFSWLRVLLALIVSVQSTFFEVMSPRGTDNWTLPVMNTLTSWLWISQLGF